MNNLADALNFTKDYVADLRAQLDTVRVSASSGIQRSTDQSKIDITKQNMDLKQTLGDAVKDAQKELDEVNKKVKAKLADQLQEAQKHIDEMRMNLFEQLNKKSYRATRMLSLFRDDLDVKLQKLQALLEAGPKNPVDLAKLEADIRYKQARAREEEDKKRGYELEHVELPTVPATAAPTPAPEDVDPVGDDGGLKFDAVKSIVKELRRVVASAKDADTNGPLPTVLTSKDLPRLPQQVQRVLVNHLGAKGPRHQVTISEDEPTLGDMLRMLIQRRSAVTPMAPAPAPSLIEVDEQAFAAPAMIESDAYMQPYAQEVQEAPAMVAPMRRLNRAMGSLKARQAQRSKKRVLALSDFL